MRTRPTDLKNCFVLLLAAVFLLTTHASAEPRMPVHLSGAYKIENVSTHGTDVRLSLEVRIVNGSDTDLSNATISFSNTLSRIRPPVAPLVLRAHSNTVVSCALTLPRQEYERWRRGARPTLSLQIPQPAGGKSIVLIRLANRRPRGR